MISIIIPVYNDGKNLLNCIKSLQKQNLKEPFEIIVIEDGSKSSLKKDLKRFKNVKYFWKVNGGPGSARNFGIKHAKGEFISFIDSDCIADKNWLYLLHKRLTNSLEFEGVGGKILNYNKEFLSSLFHLIEFGGFMGNKIKETRIVPTCNSIYRKKTLKQVNYFDENFFYGEDTDLNWKIIKLGKGIIYDPLPIVYHKTPSSIKKILKKAYFMGQGTYRTRKKNKDMENAWITNIFFISILFLFLPFISSIRFYIKNKKGLYSLAALLFYYLFWSAILIENWKKIYFQTKQ